MAKTPMKMKLPIKKRLYRNAYYLKADQPQRLKVRAAQEGRTQSQIMQDALDMYLAAQSGS